MTVNIIARVQAAVALNQARARITLRRDDVRELIARAERTDDVSTQLTEWVRRAETMYDHGWLVPRAWALFLAAAVAGLLLGHA